jgi:aryl-alcohol dehydrogenase-like predicted oxidoreductase
MDLLYEHLPNNSERAGALLKFVLQQDFIDKIIIGVENKEQLVENVKYAEASELNSKICSWPLENKFDQKIILPTNWP